MKLIDLTPFQDENGQISLVNRLQATFKYGFAWYGNMEAQKKVVALLNRSLENRYTLIRNAELGASGIVLPLILIGPSGISVFEVTALSGPYQARGDDWGTLNNGRFQPAQINLIRTTTRYAKVLQTYFEKQGATLPAPIECALLAANPGLYVESLRPNVRVVLTDAIDRFAAGLTNARPIMNAQMVNEFVERIQKPRSPKKQGQAGEDIVQDAFSLREDPRKSPPAEASRMRSILNAPKSDALIEKETDSNSELGFAFEEAPTVVRDSAPVAGIEPPDAPRSSRASGSGRILGMSVFQIVLLAFLFLCLLAVIGLAAYFVLQSPAS